MNEELTKQLVRQLKILNFWIATFGVLMLVSLGIIGFLLFQVITFVRESSQNVTNSIESAQQRLDLKQQACEGTDSFSKFLRNQTSACE